MKRKTKTLILSIVVTLILLLTFTIAYAAFSYIKTGDANQQLVLGDIYMHYGEVNAINMEGAIPGDEYTEYFEFTISGKNTYTKQDIYYDVILSYGEVAEGKTEENRIPDEYLKFKLTKVNEDLTEEVLLEDVTYDDLTNQRIYVETIDKNTTSEINNTYRLYMVISEDLIIGNTADAVITTEEFQNIFASIKVNVTGDFNKKEVALPKNFVKAVKDKYGSDTTLIAVNTEGDLYDATNTDQEIREYRYSGPTANNYVYFDTNGDGVKDTNEIWRVVGVFKDTVKDEDGNVVNDSQGNPTYEEEVKLVRNTSLTADELPESYLINGTTYTIVKNTTSAGAYWNKKASGTNNNDWTTAGLQYYLNTENDETDTSEGATANAGYLSLLTNEAKEMISPTTYYLGNVYYKVDTVKNAYIQERGTVECASSVTSNAHSDNCNIWSGNQATWDGLIGMMYPSDYGYSASDLYWETDMYGWDSAEEDGVIASDTSWMHLTMTEPHGWLLSPSSNYSINALSWISTGRVGSNNVYSNIGVRPVLNLKSGAKVIDGAGTLEEPFVIVTE